VPMVGSTVGEISLAGTVVQAIAIVLICDCLFHSGFCAAYNTSKFTTWAIWANKELLVMSILGSSFGVDKAHARDDGGLIEES